MGFSVCSLFLSTISKERVQGFYSNLAQTVTLTGVEFSGQRSRSFDHQIGRFYID